MGFNEFEEFSKGEQDVAIREFVEECIHGPAHLFFLLGGWLFSFLQEGVAVDCLLLWHFDLFGLLSYLLFSLFIFLWLLLLLGLLFFFVLLLNDLFLPEIIEHLIELLIKIFVFLSFNTIIFLDFF